MIANKPHTFHHFHHLKKKKLIEFLLSSGPMMELKALALLSYQGSVTL